MIVLGLLFVLLAAGAVVVTVMEPSTTASTASFTMFGYTVQPNHLEMFVAGAGAAVALLLGFALINAGSRRSARRRRRFHDSQAEAARLESEKRALERKLEPDGRMEPGDRLVAGPPAPRKPEDHRA